MSEFKIYKNYGVLGREKRAVYTYGGQHQTATCSDEIIVKLPKNDSFSLYENVLGQIMVECPWGHQYDINDVLEGNEKPCFFAFDTNKKGHRVYLEEI